MVDVAARSSGGDGGCTSGGGRCWVFNLLEGDGRVDLPTEEEDGPRTAIGK